MQLVDVKHQEEERKERERPLFRKRVVYYVFVTIPTSQVYLLRLVSTSCGRVSILRVGQGGRRQCSGYETLPCLFFTALYF